MINNIPASFANTVAPFAPLGRSAVGQEDTELKSSTFKPTEQMAESVRGQNRRFPDERPNDDVERDRQTALTQERRASGNQGEGDVNAESEYVQAAEARDREADIREQERLAKEEARLRAEQEQFEAEQRSLDQRQARAELINETMRRNIDINRRLIDIGVQGENHVRGALLNKTV